MIRNALFILLLLTPVHVSFAGEMDDFLDNFEKVIAVYEGYANKDPYCNSYNLKLLAEVYPAMIAMNDKAADIQSELSAGNMQRYLLLTGRYSAVMLKWSQQQAKVDISC